MGSELPAGIAVRYIGDVDGATNAYRQFPDTGRAIYSGAALAAARPTDGRELKYPLSGNARCGLCGGSLVVRSRHHESTRAYFYACSSYYHKGKSVCPNSLETPMLSADNAVLGALEQDVLRPRVLEAAIARAVDHFIRPRDSHSDHARCESLRRAVEKANGEQQRLVDAIAQGAGDVSALVGALRQRQELLLTVRSEPDGLKAPTAASFDREEIVNAAHAHAVDLQGLLRANTTEARRVLATLLDGRLTFTPKRDGRRQFYLRALARFDRFSARFLEGFWKSPSQGMASLSIPSWNQIAGFLELMRRLRDASGFAA